MLRNVIFACSGLFLISCQNGPVRQVEVQANWSQMQVKGQPTARHEAGFVKHKQYGYLIGGRRINPVNQFDPSTGEWQQKSSTPVEIHHFQAVSQGDAIYILGALTGRWPNETPVDKVIKYYPEQDKFEYTDFIPESRRRGAAAAVSRQGKIYLIGGITHGHMSGTRAWFDEYNPQTGEWKALPDAPRGRDHVQAAIIGDKLYMAAGRVSSQATNQGFELTVKEVDVFDFNTQTWSTLPEEANLPTERAGNMVIAWNNRLIVAGGESGNQAEAHNEVEVYQPELGTWTRFPDLIQGRHGTGLAVFGDTLITASGCGMRGGAPELYTAEALPLGSAENQAIAPVKLPLWNTLTLDFRGPETSEMAQINPFTDYRLQVDFYHPESQYRIRGFYAADGNAAETSADSGNIWRVHFSPDQVGEWQYTARLSQGKNIAIDLQPGSGAEVNLPNKTGHFIVTAPNQIGEGFSAKGRLTTKNGYYQFKDTDQYWMKGGTNSPENLLAYEDFDDTYRVAAAAEDGEANTGGVQLHQFSAHRQDWQKGDPSWQNGKGKSLIGALNYLSSVGMNSVYFLTMNINGDGKDVWPYISHSTFDRFDVSKLAQWEVVFTHMQSKGMMLHIVTQETENELLLDNGETGDLRKLYYSELIARFGHHLGLTWNLGEENGPASWSPNGQNDQQRKDMTTFITEADPYNHPILLHTHSTAEDKEHLLPALLGFTPLDGLSFQVNRRERVNKELVLWREKARAAGHEWMITMDEIGEWFTGAMNDFEDPDHDTLRQHALWGSLLAGGAGVEWYFGARHPHNDLTSEDWRSRHNLWVQTKHAMDFFSEHLPYWEMRPVPELINDDRLYAFADPGNIYAVYLPAGRSASLKLPHDGEVYSLRWFDPKSGGELVISSVNSLTGEGFQSLHPPTSESAREWVALVTRTGQ